MNYHAFELTMLAFAGVQQWYELLTGRRPSVPFARQGIAL